MGGLIDDSFATGMSADEIFAATFLYAIVAMVGVDRSGSGHVPVVSLCIVIGFLVATAAM